MGYDWIKQDRAQKYKPPKSQEWLVNGTAVFQRKQKKGQKEKWTEENYR
jgi:hypothetical protein